MPRYLFALALCLAFGGQLQAQVYTIQPRSMRVENKPRGSFSLSVRYGGATNVVFEDVGAIPSLRDLGNLTDGITRVYDDGFVGLDTRTSAENDDDGRTNRWAYNYATQQTNGDIALHQYSTASNDTDIEIDSGALAGIDMQYDFVVGVFGAKLSDKIWTFTWGGMFGGVFSPVNTKSRQQVTVDLVTVTDLYSLEGAAMPAAPYTAPSTTTVTETAPDGTTFTRTIDNTTLLNSRPYSRSAPVTLADAALVDGFWQVKGAIYSVRAGPWLRWHLGSRLSLRASAGVAFSYVGVKMEYDEILNEGFVNIRSPQFLRGGNITEPDDANRFGVFGSLDAEWWISDRTSFFASLTYEDTGDDLEIIANQDDEDIPDRRAVVELPNGTGFRVGVTVLF